MSRSIDPHDEDAPFDKEDAVNFPLDPGEHPSESVDRMLAATADAYLDDAEEALENGNREKGFRALLLADEVNERRSEYGEMPIPSGVDHIVDDDVEAVVDALLAGIVRDMTLIEVDDAEMNAHIDEMRKEVAARVSGGDA